MHALTLPDPGMGDRPSCRETAASALVALCKVNKIAQVETVVSHVLFFGIRSIQGLDIVGTHLGREVLRLAYTSAIFKALA